MADFMYLFRRPGQPTESPQKLQELMQRWQDWYKELEKGGHLVETGHPLELTGTVVTTAQGSYRDGPYTETKDIVGGYSIILAKDMAEAIALTHGHPVFEMGGMIEVRPLVKL